MVVMTREDSDSDSDDGDTFFCSVPFLSTAPIPDEAITVASWLVFNRLPTTWASEASTTAASQIRPIQS